MSFSSSGAIVREIQTGVNQETHRRPHVRSLGSPPRRPRLVLGGVPSLPPAPATGVRGIQLPDQLPAKDQAGSGTLVPPERGGLESHGQAMSFATLLSLSSMNPLSTL